METRTNESLPIAPPRSQHDTPERERLGRARVVIVGVGGLGSPVALQLAAAGVGTLVLVDPDRVELSNLNRQLLHRTAGVGTLKVASAAARLHALYPDVRVEMHAESLGGDNAARLFRHADFVVDATDGSASKFGVNDGAVRTRTAFSHAGILGFQGQTMTVVPGRSACFRCLFPEPPSADAVPTCQEAGIVGAVAGMIGAVQAGEALKYLLGAGTLLTDRLLVVDAWSHRWRTVALSRNPRCPLCGDQRAAARASDHEPPSVMPAKAGIQAGGGEDGSPPSRR